MERARTMIRRSFPWAVAAALASVMAFLGALGSGIVQTTGLSLGALLVLAAPLSRRALPRPLVAALVTGAVTLLWFAVTSARALNPAVSFVGLVGQNNGFALLLLGLVWLSAGAMWADAAGLRRLLGVVAVSGAVFTAAQLLEYAGQGSQRVQGYAAGFFENSSSLGQYLAVSALCAAAWAFAEKRGGLRWAAIAAGALSILGILLATSRTGVLAALAGAAVSAVAARMLTSERAARWTTAAVVAATALVTAALVASSMGVFGAGAEGTVDALTNERGAIWASAGAQVSRAPLFGEGMQQFSALISWDLNGGVPTTDPHNFLLSLLLGGGVVGVLLAGATLSLVVYAALEAARANRSASVALVMSLPAALLAAGLVGWIAPTALLAVTAVTGAGLGVAAARQPKKAQRTEAAPDPRLLAATRAVAVACGAAALVLAAFTARSLPQAYLLTKKDVPAETLLASYRGWPDPQSASVAFRQLLGRMAAGDAAAARTASDAVEPTARDTSWRVDLAAVQLIVMQQLDTADPANFARFLTVVERGRRADPASGAWYALPAMEAERLGEKEQAASFARRALAFELVPAVRQQMERLAGQ